jgi:hypothetical protein
VKRKRLRKAGDSLVIQPRAASPVVVESSPTSSAEYVSEADAIVASPKETAASAASEPAGGSAQIEREAGSESPVVVVRSER